MSHYWLLRFQAARLAGFGFALGSAAGAAAHLFDILPVPDNPPWWIDLLVGLMYLVAVPLLVCLLTRRVRSIWLPIVLLVAAALTVPWAYLCVDRFLPSNGFSFAARSFASLSPSWADMLVVPLLATAIISIPTLLMRRFIPALRKPHPAP